MIRLNSKSKQFLFKTNIFKRKLSSAFGQPHWETHPFLLKKDELLKGIKKDEFQKRRDVLLKNLKPKSLIAMAGYTERLMSNDIPYEFRQCSNFLYYTGVLESNAAILFDSGDRAAGVEPRVALFVEPRDANRERWDGPRTGVERASDMFGIDDVYEANQMQAVVDQWQTERQYETMVATGPRALVAPGGGHSGGWTGAPALTQLFEKQRLIKSASEIEAMHRSARVAARAFVDVMRTAQAGDLEKSLSSALDHHCRRRGADRLSFPPVVANGAHALSLHYIANDQHIRDGDMVVFDGGCEMQGYCSDITRTFPVASTFSEAQKDVYERVLDVNNKCIQLCDNSQYEKSFSIFSIQRHAERLLTEHLLDMKILKGTIENNLQSRDFFRFYPHNIGHWLGMDTHDTHSISTSTALQPGMAITIEPGLYIDDGDDVPSKYHNICVRVEDNIVIQENAPALVLTTDVPKTVSEIENLRQIANQNCKFN